MGITRTTLELYKDVTAGTDDKTQFHVPATGEFSIVCIEGEAAFDINCAVAVMFDGAIVWVTKGSSTMDRPKRFTGDGVKKVELVLDANDLPSGSVFLGGYVLIEQET
jgi:hypothetical protein